MKGKDWCRIDGPLEHMGGEHIVVVREQQASPAAAVVTAHFDSDLGRRPLPLPDHKLVFCAVDSEDEALYIAAFVNSTPIQRLLDSFASATAISPTTLRRLPIPPYDLGDPLMIELTAVARSATAGSEVQEQLDALVNRLLEARISATS